VHPHGAGETATILVVEDDAGLCFALEQGLLAEGFDVQVATDATEGLELAAALEPDVVLLDWMLPEGLGGPRTCEQMREAAPASRVIMLTGLDDLRDQRAALEAGAVAFLRKGLPLSEIASTVRRVLPTGRFERAPERQAPDPT
jgi:DNA-binding response OmpR family regulator